MRDLRRRSMVLLILYMTLVLFPTYGSSGQAGPPELTISGEVHFRHDGVHPMSGDTEQVFAFGIRYLDPDGDAPKQGYPRLLIDTNNDGDFDDRDDLNMTMMHADVPPFLYQDGVDYIREWRFDEEGTFGYAFFVLNEANESAFIGPFKGPVVLPVEKDIHEEDWLTEVGLWFVLLLLCSIVFFVVGMGTGQKGERKRIRKKRAHQRREGEVEQGMENEDKGQD